ncbi:hypothetical protein RRG08_014505 [Elysia crispata]|uniref:Uncharacterized protein n=1 Tax=Elysia crispata TaxID=231223 RepID=A0AAE0XTL0_9GAST|nr:hypothetical protein RRG08_014505 [Elysia crispata]
MNGYFEQAGCVRCPQISFVMSGHFEEAGCVRCQQISFVMSGHFEEAGCAVKLLGSHPKHRPKSASPNTKYTEDSRRRLQLSPTGTLTGTLTGILRAASRYTVLEICAIERTDQWLHTSRNPWTNSLR